MTIGEEFAKFSVDLKFEALPSDVINQTKLFFLDWLGSAIRGAQEEPARIAVETIRELGGIPESSVFADRSKNSCIMSALANGVCSHVVEMDDLHRKGIFHPGAPVFSAALAVGEKLHVSGKRFIESIVAGYEVGVRSAESVGGSHYHYWHTTGTCGTFGAAAAAAKLLSLDKMQTTWAIGSAGTQASGLWEFLTDSAMSKQLHPAKAAVNGILSAFLAKKGFTGAASIFEGEKGFLKATSSDYSIGKAIAGIGEGAFKISECSLKKHASCGHTHSSIDATLGLLAEQHISPDEIENVHVRLYSQALDLLGEIEPTTPFFAKFCLPFCIATALIYGKAGLEAFTEKRLKNQTLFNVMERISIERDNSLTALYPEKWSAIVSITTKGSASYQKRVEHPKGDPENPMSQNEVVEKYKNMTQANSRECTERILESVMNLEKVEDVSQILNCFIN